MVRTRKFASGATGLTVTDTGDFLQLRNGTGQLARILEIRVLQTSENDVVMNGIVMTRGTTGASGVPHTEWEYDVSGASAGVVVVGQADPDVSLGDWQETFGWNAINEFVWTPPPQHPLVLAESDRLGVALRVADTITVGYFVAWEETGI